MMIRAPWPALALALLLGFAARADDKGSVSVGELGVGFQSGKTGKSLTGVNSYFAALRAEQKKSMFRTHVGAELQMASGSTTVGAQDTSFNLYGAQFLAGAHLFGFPISKVQPFVGLSGILAWEFFKQGTPASGSDPQTQSICFGYEFDAGVDIRQRPDGSAIRVRSGLYNVSGSLGGISGFSLNAVRFSIGYVW